MPAGTRKPAGSTQHDRLRRENERLRRETDQLQREKGPPPTGEGSPAARSGDRLRRQIGRLKEALAAARRAGFRQAAPFAKDRRQGRGRTSRPTGRARTTGGTGVGSDRRESTRPTVRGHRRARTAAARSHGDRVATQYQEDLPAVRPLVRRFDIEVGHCSRCGRRVQGRHALQTSDALGRPACSLVPGSSRWS